MVQNLKMLEEASRNKDLDAEANGSDEARRLGLRFRLRDGLLYYTNFERLCIPNDRDLSQTPASGSLNWAITISFEDGVDWIFRSPRTYYGVDTEVKHLVMPIHPITKYDSTVFCVCNAVRL